MIQLPIAHFGHWYHALLYLAPVVIVVGVLWILERRERGRDAGEDDLGYDDPA
jgi:hypothetical protein